MVRAAAWAIAAVLTVFPGISWAQHSSFFLAPLGIEMVRMKMGDRYFYISRYEVTQKQWRSVMRNNPSRSENCPTCPVSRIGWSEVGIFLARASQVTGRALRLPTEAEWQFAAAGGEPGTTFPGTNDPGDAGSFAWFADNSGGSCQEVGTREPNLFGLYDMGGNVWEWVTALPQTGPSPEGEEMATGILKGGSWRSGIDDLRVGSRADRDPGCLGKGCLPLPLVPERQQLIDVGFRLALSVVEP